MGCAVFDFAWKSTFLLALMLFLPFIDRLWSLPKYRSYQYQFLLWSMLIAVILVIFLFNPVELNFILYTILLVALPEEWFFRAYYLQRLEKECKNKLVANIYTSFLFAIMHFPLQGIFGLAVFIPSIFIGWVFQKHRDLVLVILIHVLMNLIYIVFIKNILEGVI